MVGTMSLSAQRGIYPNEFAPAPDTNYLYICVENVNGVREWQWMHRDSVMKSYVLEVDMDTSLWILDANGMHNKVENIGINTDAGDYAITIEGKMNLATTGKDVFIGKNAGKNDDGTSNYNIGIGGYALVYNTSGYYNTAIGYQSMFYNQVGKNNTAIGFYSLRANQNGGYNTAIGFYSLRANQNGGYNTAIGVSSLAKAVGDHNTAIGYQAGYQADADNVMIGYRSGYYETGSNKLYIENSLSTEPLIYGEFDNDLIRLNSNLEIRDIAQCMLCDSVLVKNGDEVKWSMGIGFGGSDDQDLTGATLDASNILTIDIEDGASTSVDLSSLDNSGTDDQKVDKFNLNGTNLELSIEDDGEADKIVDLSGFMDNTDDQNISGSGLSGTVLTIGIENGTNETVDLASLQDGTGTDNQNLSVTTDSLLIENGHGAYLDDINFWDLATYGVQYNNNVGIGVAPSSAYDLYVYGTTSLNSQVKLGYLYNDDTKDYLLGVDNAGNIITVTKSSVGGGGSGYWTASGDNIYNNNAQYVGINDATPSYQLDVNGTGRFTSNLTIGNYTLPTSDGSYGYVLKTNGSGTVSWQADNTSSSSGSYWTLAGSNLYNNSGSYVLINTTTNNSSDELQVIGDAYISGKIRIAASSGSSTNTYGNAGQVLTSGGSYADAYWSDASGSSATKFGRYYIYEGSGWAVPTTETLVPLDNESMDPESNFYTSSSQIKVYESGYYKVNTTLSVETTNQYTSHVEVRFKKNGSAIANTALYENGTAEGTGEVITLGDIIYMSTSDALGVYIRKSGATTADIIVNNYSVITLIKL